MQTIKAIETVYRGYRFRSRTEARWAVYFDALGIEWEYEKEGYDLGELGWYLPDFWLPDRKNELYSSAGYFIEIKGDLPTANELNRIVALANSTKHTVWLFAFSPGSQVRYIAHNKYNQAFQASYGTSKTFDLYSAFSRFEYLTIDDIESAVMSARSARFEHGENGAKP